MRRLFIMLALLVLPSILDARIAKWKGKPIPVSISAQRLTRIEFSETLRSVFLSRADIAVEREERSLYIRALAPEIEDTLFVVEESGTTYEINLSTSDNQHPTLVITHIPKSLQAQAERARQVPALDLMRSMMRGMPMDWVRDHQSQSQRSLPGRLFLHETHRSLSVSRASRLRD
jgi:hypothetical protein